MQVIAPSLKKLKWSFVPEQRKTLLRRMKDPSVLSGLGCSWGTGISSHACALLVSCENMNLTMSLSSGLGSAECNRYSSHCKIKPSGGNSMLSYLHGATQRTESRKCKSYTGIKREREGVTYQTGESYLLLHKTLMHYVLGLKKHQSLITLVIVIIIVY